MSDRDRTFTMSGLVEQTDVAAATIRYYLHAGLLPPPTRVAPNRFLYDERHVEAIRLVRLLRDRRGLSLEAIADLLPELLPDVLGKPEGSVFRSQMWGRMLSDHTARNTGPTIRERLLVSGLTAFSERGYSDVTIEDVCRGVSIAKGSFYRHFDSKEQLFRAVAVEAGNRSAAGFLELVGSDPLDDDRAAALFRTALAPYVVVLFDLASLAGRERAGLGAVLGAVLDRFHMTVRSCLLDSGHYSADLVVGRGFLEVLRAVADRSREEIGGDRAGRAPAVTRPS